MIEPIPFLWLCGPSGVGKSTVGYEVFRQVSDEGSSAAYVDADQLGLCYPAPADDPYNHRLKARNLGAVWASFRARGVETLILSGGIESARQVPAYADVVAGTTLTLCRLRAGHATLTQRFVRRGWMPHLVTEALAEVDELDRLDFADTCVDTDGLSIMDVARLVRRSLGHHRPPAPERPRDVPPATVTGDPVPVLFLCGATAVGKSTVGYEVFTRIRKVTKAAYVDLAQIGFCEPIPGVDPGNHRLKAANLAAMWPAFRDAGARCLVVTGQVDDAATLRTYTAALPAMTFTVIRLHASPDALTERVLRRGRNDGPALVGDDLRGQPPGRLQEAAEQAARDADRLHSTDLGDLWIDTDNRSIEDVAHLVIDKCRLVTLHPRLAGPQR